MANMKIVKLFIIMSVLAIQGAFASSRTDDVLAADAMNTLKVISVRLDEIQVTKNSLKKLEESLKAAKKGKSTYIKIRNVAGTLAIVAIAVGAYKIQFGGEGRFGGLKVMLGSYLAVSGFEEGLIKLNQKEIEKLSREIIMSYVKISRLEKAIKSEVGILCEQDPRHQLCYGPNLQE